MALFCTMCLTPSWSYSSTQFDSSKSKSLQERTSKDSAKVYSLSRYCPKISNTIKNREFCISRIDSAIDFDLDSAYRFFKDNLLEYVEQKIRFVQSQENGTVRASVFSYEENDPKDITIVSRDLYAKISKKSFQSKILCTLSLSRYKETNVEKEEYALTGIDNIYGDGSFDGLFFTPPMPFIKDINTLYTGFVLKSNNPNKRCQSYYRENIEASLKKCLIENDTKYKISKLLLYNFKSYNSRNMQTQSNVKNLLKQKGMAEYKAKEKQFFNGPFINDDSVLKATLLVEGGIKERRALRPFRISAHLGTEEKEGRSCKIKISDFLLDSAL